MSFPAAVFPDVELPVVTLLAALLDDLGEDVTVAVGVPSSWSPNTSQSHIQVSCDGVPIIRRQIFALATIRLAAWAAHTSEAKRLAALVQGLLCSHSAGVILGALPLTGVLPARDDQTHAEIASTTTRVTVRSVPIEPSGS